MKQERTLKSTLHALWRAFPWLWLAAGYLFDLWYHIVPGKWIIDSDLAAEMQLAELLNQENSILHQGWYYSTELRVFHMQWFYRLGLLLFPDNWHAARVVAMALTLLVLVGLYLFFAHASGFARLGVWTAAVQLWPFGRIYLFLCLYGGYYLIYSMFTFLTLGCLLHSMKADTPRKRALWLALACVSAAACGLNGVRMMMVLFAPLLLASCAVAILSVRCKGLTSVQQLPAACPQELWMLGASVAMALANAAGYLYNQKVLGKQMNFKLYDDMYWSMNIWGDKPNATPVNCLMGLLNQFGYNSSEKLFSFTGITGGIGLMLGCLMFFCVIRLLARFSRLSLVQQLLTALTVCAIGVDLVVFVYLNNYGIAYWMPVLPLMIVCLQIEGETETFHLQGARQAAALLVAAAFTLCSLGTVSAELKSPLRGEKELDTVCDWLVENGYKEGYATFWLSHAMIEMTSHQLDVWTYEEHTGNLYCWLEPVSHKMRVPQSPVFLVTYSYEDPLGQPPYQKNGGTLVYQNDRFCVYELPDIS